MTEHLPPPPPLRPVTPVERISARWLGAFFLAFLVIGLLSNGYALVKGKFDVLSRPIAWSDFVHGKAMDELAKDLANAPLPDEIARLERGVSWLVAGDLGPRVRQGERDWLFLVDELTPHAGGVASAQARATDVIAMRDRLKREGISLLVVLVPDKTRIAAAHLGAIHRPAVFTPRIDDFMRVLEGAGVQAVNLTEPLAAMNADGGAQPFLRTDTHWSEQGAEVAAQAIASRVRAIGVQPVPTVNRQIATQVVSPRSGDLIRLAGIDWLPASLAPRPDDARATTFSDSVSAPMSATATATATASAVAPASAAAAAAAPAPGSVSAPEPNHAAKSDDSDLFGDADLPNIALVGTSFSRTSDFVPFLDYALHTRVASFARDGGGFSTSLLNFLKSPTFKETPPKLIIWEIPERVLQASASSDRINGSLQ